MISQFKAREEQAGMGGSAEIEEGIKGFWRSGWCGYPFVTGQRLGMGRRALSEDTRSWLNSLISDGFQLSSYFRRRYQLRHVGRAVPLDNPLIWYQLRILRMFSWIWYQFIFMFDGKWFTLGSAQMQIQSKLKFGSKFKFINYGALCVYYHGRHIDTLSSFHEIDTRMFLFISFIPYVLFLLDLNHLSSHYGPHWRSGCRALCLLIVSLEMRPSYMQQWHGSKGRWEMQMKYISMLIT